MPQSQTDIPTDPDLTGLADEELDARLDSLLSNIERDLDVLETTSAEAAALPLAVAEPTITADEPEGADDSPAQDDAAPVPADLDVAVPASPGGAEDFGTDPEPEADADQDLLASLDEALDEARQAATEAKAARTPAPEPVAQAPLDDPSEEPAETDEPFRAGEVPSTIESDPQADLIEPDAGAAPAAEAHELAPAPEPQPSADPAVTDSEAGRIEASAPEDEEEEEAPAPVAAPPGEKPADDHAPESEAVAVAPPSPKPRRAARAARGGSVVAARSIPALRLLAYPMRHVRPEHRVYVGYAALNLAFLAVCVWLGVMLRAEQPVSMPAGTPDDAVLTGPAGE